MRSSLLAVVAAHLAELPKLATLPITARYSHHRKHPVRNARRKAIAAVGGIRQFKKLRREVRGHV